MKRLAVFLLVFGIVAPVFAATPIMEKTPGDRGMLWNMESALTIAAAMVCNPPAGCAVSDFARAEIVPGIAHYSAVVQVGPGAYDRIGIHRVVREYRLGHPIRTPDRVFLQHGCCKNFVGMFLPGLYSPSIPDDFGLAVYLADRHVDVWGIDQAWTMVPAATADFAFMADWGLQRQVDDLRTAVSVAREVRRLTGDSGDRFNLLGYSSGATTGYALLDEESQLPKRQRHVQGFVAADYFYKFAPQLDQSSECSAAASDRALYDQGVFQWFVPFKLIGGLARYDPDGSSPMVPGLTNMQAMLTLLSYPLDPYSTGHFLAGEFDAFGMTTGFQYVQTEAAMDFLESGVSWEPLLFGIESSEVHCDAIDSPHDDHLMDIRVPVYNWGSAGGWGPMGEYTLSLLGSKDVSQYMASTWPEDDVLMDFGHVDLFAAENAPELAWAPLLDWLRYHR